jgi:hypothetical protein
MPITVTLPLTPFFWLYFSTFIYNMTKPAIVLGLFGFRKQCKQKGDLPNPVARLEFGFQSASYSTPECLYE